MSHTLPALLFDLDGTLTDSKPGILGCLRKVINARNLGDCGILDRFVGPPVEEWCKELLPQGSEEDRAKMARDYRACYNLEGWSNNSVFPGIREMLAKLKHQGFPLYVCTSKFRPFAVRIVDHFELTPFFNTVYGDRPEFESHSKVDLLAGILSELRLGHDSAWMIGDRIYDIDAAHANHLRCVAAAWGYGAQDEWDQADAVAATPADVFAFFSAQDSAATASAQPRIALA
jgi:phosphoglycolate phosphatase